MDDNNDNNIKDFEKVTNIGLLTKDELIALKEEIDEEITNCYAKLVIASTVGLTTIVPIFDFILNRSFKFSTPVAIVTFFVALNQISKAIEKLEINNNKFEMINNRLKDYKLTLKKDLKTL